MLVARVPGDEVEDDLDPELVCGGNQAVDVGERAEVRMHVAIVGDVVAPIGVRRRVDRVEPDPTDAEPPEVIEPVDDAGEVADPVAVRIRERARIDLVQNSALPPWLGHAQRYPALQ